MEGRCIVCKSVAVLVIVGALNWGLVGIMRMDLVARLFGDMTTISRVIYSLIGVAGLLKLAMIFKACPCSCGKTAS